MMEFSRDQAVCIRIATIEQSCLQQYSTIGELCLLGILGNFDILVCLLQHDRLDFIEALGRNGDTEGKVAGKRNGFLGQAVRVSCRAFQNTVMQGKVDAGQNRTCFLITCGKRCFINDLCQLVCFGCDGIGWFGKINGWVGICFHAIDAVLGILSFDHGQSTVDDFHMQCIAINLMDNIKQVFGINDNCASFFDGQVEILVLFIA